MVEIKEYKRDDSKDYLNILKALNEIPFPVGKKLLIDFLKGNLENNSINKNKLFDLRNFAKLEILEENKIEELIDKLIGKKLIDLSPSFFNKFMKVLSITSKGQEELINPVAFLDKGLNKNLISKTEISDSEIRAFNELDDL